MKDLQIKLIRKEIENLKLKYSLFKAYAEFQNYISKNPKDRSELNDEDIQAMFPKPPLFDREIETEKNELGDELIDTEWSEQINLPLSILDDFGGWLNDRSKRDELYGDQFYQEKIRKAMGKLSQEEKQEVELHATHILGRCSNPNDWEQNKRGLVCGMIQSGKTANMITLMGLARTAGYRVFIVLAGDKTGLRAQTQKRINEAFDLNPHGYSNDPRNNIQSLTTSDEDYIGVSRTKSNALELWPHNNKTTIIICIKKQKDNLNKLLKHLKELESACKEGTGQLSDILNYENDFKSMIIDDEADYASQDTAPDVGGSTINKKIVEIREQLKQNCYIAYTATPQACIGADPDNPVGYPGDFIWLLDCHRDELGATSSYLGLEEFFEIYPTQLLSTLHKDSWPYWEKNEQTGRREKLYSPSGKVDEQLLTDLELAFVNLLIDDSTERSAHCHDYKVAMVDFILGCSIRWYRHYIDCQTYGHFQTAKPTIEQIEGIMKSKEDNYEPFPYHAMMFNLSYINRTQRKIVELIALLWEEVQVAWEATKSSAWHLDNLFRTAYSNQLEKSRTLERNIPTAEELEHFIIIAIDVVSKHIIDVDKFVYLLNSQDEGLTLDYSAKNKSFRPKKAAIIVGGNILARGLTIEKLSVSVFARSQVMSLGDTNLQMCRWFGHKKAALDLQTVYMQYHSQKLFGDITEADRELRQQFKHHIYESTPNDCLMLALYNSPLFKVTSRSKSKFLAKSTGSAYSGTAKDIVEHIKHPDFLDNNKLLDDYISSLPVSVHKKFQHKRAMVYYDVEQDVFFKFFKSLKFHDDALKVSPSKYFKYLEKWRTKEELPKINIAIFGSNEKPSKRARKIVGNKKLQTSEEIRKNADERLSVFRGVKSDKNAVKKNPDNAYCGDIFVDLPLLFHKNNYDKKNLRRDRGNSILFLFYKLDANYLSGHIYIYPDQSKKSVKTYAMEGDKLLDTNKSLYIDTTEPLLTLSIATPIGGPMSTVYENKLINIDSDKCGKYLNFVHSKYEHTNG